MLQYHLDKGPDRLGISRVIVVLGLLFGLNAGIVSAQAVQDNIDALNRIDVVERLGAKVDPNLRFVNDAGNAVRLGEFFNEDKPILLTLGYYECPMLCNLVFNGLTAGVEQLRWRTGEQFQMITVSIDPGETVDLAAAKKKNYLAGMSSIKDNTAWQFLIAEESQSKALADAVGFKYYYDESQDEYAHPAVAIILTPDGTISRYLYGIEFKKQDLRLALLEASEGKIGNTIDRLILYCFHYDPDAKGYVVFASNVMRLGGAATAVILAVFLGTLWARERLGKKKVKKGLVSGQVH